MLRDNSFFNPSAYLLNTQSPSVLSFVCGMVSSSWLQEHKDLKIPQWLSISSSVNK